MGARQKAELAALAKLPDEAVDTGDIPEIADWRGAEIGKFYRPRKQIVTIRLDADILAWFKARGAKYQTAVNRALRDHVLQESRASLVKRSSRKAARG